MRVISNTDYDALLRLIPRLIGATNKKDLRASEAARQLSLIIDKWERKGVPEISKKDGLH